MYFLGTENVDRFWPFKEKELGGCKHASQAVHLESCSGCQAVDQTGFFGASPNTDERFFSISKHLQRRVDTLSCFSLKGQTWTISC